MANKKARRGPHQREPTEDLSARLLLQSTALAATGNGVIITDRTGAILWVNPAFSVLTGYTLEEVIGANPRILKSGKQEAEFYRELWQTLLAGRTWRGKFVNRRKDGRIYINEETITPVRLHGGEITHFVGVMQDVTEREQAEAEIRQLNEQLEERVRWRTSELQTANHELEAFAYSVSHDLRAPLRHINGFLDLLTKTALPALSQEEQHYFRQIADSARQMDRLIDDLLLFSRMGQAILRPERIDLNQLLHEALAQVEPEAKDRKILWTKRDLPHVQADCSMLRQVLVNLLSNAIKYTRPRNPAEIEIGAVQPENDEVIVFVRDNGVGFDMRFADKLFGVFQRLHSSADFEGTGIGLANVRRIIVRHGGRTWAEGKPNGGATFFFSLPKPAADGAAFVELNRANR
jgi:PAS domain S-box-containing protein